MVQRHCSTASQRVSWVSELIADSGSYGVVSHLSQTISVSRQTLYSWKAKGQAALEQALGPAPTATAMESKVQIERAILTLLVEGHASYRGIQRCLWLLLGVQVSLGKIAAVVQSAGELAQHWLSRHTPATARGVALDELYGPGHGEGYQSAGRCPQWGGLGQHQSGRGGWGELDLVAVATGGARTALADGRQ